MKKLAVYYSFIAAPLLLLSLALTYSRISNELFSLSILFYALVYHPVVSGFRLIAPGKIRRSQFWLNFIPFWNRKYFKELFFSA